MSRGIQACVCACNHTGLYTHICVVQIHRYTHKQVCMFADAHIIQIHRCCLIRSHPVRKWLVSCCFLCVAPYPIVFSTSWIRETRPKACSPAPNQAPSLKQGTLSGKNIGDALAPPQILDFKAFWKVILVTSKESGIV